MGDYAITGTSVRLDLGLTSSDISDADMESLVTQAETETDRLINTKVVPTRVIERHETPTQPSYIMLRKTPVTRVVGIMIGGTAGTWVDPSGAVIDPNTGKLRLRSTADATYFDAGEEEGNTIDYYYGLLDETSTETTLSAEVGTGSRVVMTVASATGFSADDYVKVEGVRDDSPEISKINAVGTGTMDAALSVIHRANARVVKMQPNKSAKELCRAVAGIMASLHMIGGKYDFATSYTIPEKSVTKGQPRETFQRTLDNLVSRRDQYLKVLRRVAVA